MYRIYNEQIRQSKNDSHADTQTVAVLRWWGAIDFPNEHLGPPKVKIMGNSLKTA